jgi:protein-tyrosine phosphatase
MPSILVVCTGNICRSPIAEGFLRHLLGSRGAAAIDVSSAGTSGWDGAPATDEAVQAELQRGIDISSHRARRLHPTHVLQADLVIGMTTMHRDRAVDMVPEVRDRSFTLKELVRLLEALPERDGTVAPDGRTLADRVAEASRLRDEGFEGNPLDEDVADPIGMSLAIYRAVAWELDEQCERLVTGLVGKTTPRSMAGLWREGE